MGHPMRLELSDYEKTIRFYNNAIAFPTFLQTHTKKKQQENLKITSPMALRRMIKRDI